MIRYTCSLYASLSLPYAAGGLYSTVVKLYRWQPAPYTEPLVSQESLDRMFTPHARMTMDGLGCGCFLRRMNQHQTVGQGGGIDGFVTEIRRYIAGEVAMILLSNHQTPNLPQFAEEIASVVSEK